MSPPDRNRRMTLPPAPPLHPEQRLYIAEGDIDELKSDVSDIKKTLGTMELTLDRIEQAKKSASDRRDWWMKLALYIVGAGLVGAFSWIAAIVSRINPH